MKNYYDEYVSYLKIDKWLSNNTVLYYEYHVKKFLKHFEKADVHKIGHDDLVDYIIFIRDTLSDHTLKQCILSIQSLFRFLHYDRKILNNPAKTLEVPKTWFKIPEVLSTEQIRILIDHAEKKESQKRGF